MHYRTVLTRNILSKLKKFRHLNVRNFHNTKHSVNHHTSSAYARTKRATATAHVCERTRSRAQSHPPRAMSSAQKNPELDAAHQAILRQMMLKPENKQCADCKAPSPRWASTNLGVFVCIACSGIHRKIGTHVSQVRSVTLDTWTAAQVALFQTLGNAKAAALYEACLPPDFRRPAASDAMFMERFIREKYEYRRFVKVEDGGLGGSVMPSRRAAPLNSASHSLGMNRASGLQPYSSSSGRNVYDDFSSSKNNLKPGSMSSYARQFRNAGGGGYQSGGAGGVGGKFNANRGLSPRSSFPSGRATPMQRMSAVKEIMDMGFPAQLAARAVEAGDGDLQRAVEWVLQQNAPTSTTPLPSVQPVQVRAPEPPARDLMDFGDPPPSAATNNASAPPANGARSTASSGVMEATPPAVPQWVADDDFADFGSFESALPASAAAPTSPKPGAPQTGTAFSSSLASLYTQAATVPVALPVTQPAPGSAPHSASAFPSVIAPQGTGSNLAAFYGQSTASHSSPVQSPKFGGTQVAANLSSLPKSPAPPPLPVASEAVSSSDPLPPPPPTSPPPPLDANGTQGDPLAGEDAVKSPAPTVFQKKDEDPFADLARVALSTAASSKKRISKPVDPVSPRPQAPATTEEERPSLLGEQFSSLPTVPAKTNNTAPQGLSLEDLLG